MGEAATFQTAGEVPGDLVGAAVRQQAQPLRRTVVAETSCRKHLLGDVGNIPGFHLGAELSGDDVVLGGASALDK